MHIIIFLLSIILLFQVMGARLLIAILFNSLEIAFSIFILSAWVIASYQLFLLAQAGHLFIAFTGAAFLIILALGIAYFLDRRIRALAAY